MAKSRHNKEPLPLIEKRPLTKSEELLTHIGELVHCDICQNQVIMNYNWLMTAERDIKGNFINKRAVCPNCRDAVQKTGILLVTI